IRFNLALLPAVLNTVAVSESGCLTAISSLPWIKVLLRPGSRMEASMRPTSLLRISLNFNKIACRRGAESKRRRRCQQMPDLSARRGWENLLRKTSLIVALLVIASSAGARAQTVSGTLQGHVTDQSGALVHRAAVSARNSETGLERKTVT